MDKDQDFTPEGGRGGHHVPPPATNGAATKGTAAKPSKDTAPTRGDDGPEAAPPIAEMEFELGFHKELNEATDLKDFRKRILTVVNRMGFSDYNFTHPETVDDREAQLLMSPPDLVDSYYKGGFFPYDIVTEYAKNNTRPIFLSELERYVNETPFETDIHRQNRELFRLLKSYGYYDIYLIPISSIDISGRNNGGNVLLSVETKDQSPDDFKRNVLNHKDTLKLLAEAINHIGNTKFANFLIGPRSTENLTPHSRPLHLLDLLAREDIGLNDAADKMGISIHTANQHMATVKKAFGVSTTNGAIYRAIRAGLIRCRRY